MSASALTLDAPVRHLLVDLDGTLVGYREVGVSWNFVKGALGELRRYGGWRKAASTLLALQKELKRKGQARMNDVRAVELFAKRMGMDPTEARRILREGLFVIFPRLEKHFFPIPGAREFLAWAHGRYPLILATNPVWPPEIVDLRVRWAGIDPSMFRFMTHVRTMRACKPEPEYYEAILRQQGLPASDCLLVGNELKMDLPATRIGIRVFIVGKRAKPERLPPRKGRALAWRGSYSHLKALLETGGEARVSTDARAT